MTFPTRLVKGYGAFVDTRLSLERSRYEKLAETGQRPDVMVICCCDSRVSPEVIFNAHPGEMFVVRNVANLVPPYSPTGLTHGVSAALEFAVQILKAHALRRHPRLCRTSRPADRRRFHRQLDVFDRAGGQIRRRGKRRCRRRLPRPAGASVGRDDLGQPDDLSRNSQPGGRATSPAAWCLFRR